MSATNSQMPREIQGFSDVAFKPPREIVDFKGECRLNVSDGFITCNDSVSWVLGHRSASFTFSVGQIMYVLTGIGSRQNDSENYYQVISAIQVWNNRTPQKHYNDMDGFCHLRSNKDATKFFFVKCIVNNPESDEVYRFYLEKIRSFSRK